nr:cupin domain-containing protein [Palleronia pontilimi]
MPTTIRYGELIARSTAPIDAHIPGSDQRQTFAIIGGLSGSADQQAPIASPHGFSLRAAGQPPRVRNALHAHRTEQVLFVLSGRWRFFWGLHGDAGDVILERGDILKVPTGLFRGFENVGEDDAMIMEVLGGGDAGGDVIWAPQVIEDAKAHGLVLGENGRLYDSKNGESLPDGVKPVSPLTGDDLKAFADLSPMQVVGQGVRRYNDMAALARTRACKVIGETGIIRDAPGFEVDLLTRSSAKEAMHEHDRPSVLIPVFGHWRVNWPGGSEVIGPGDTMSVPSDLPHNALPSMPGEAALYHIIATDDAAEPSPR